MRQSALAGLLLMTAACSGAPMPLATPEENAAGQRFEAPAAGQAALYLYTRRGGPYSITANRLALGDVAYSHWMRVTLTPGKQDLRCAAPGMQIDPGSLLLYPRPGETLYVAVDFTLSSLSCTLTLEVPAAAQPTILAGKRVRELE